MDKIKDITEYELRYIYSKTSPFSSRKRHF